jgi:hypothetical protein
MSENLNKNTVKNLKKIKKLFDKAETLFSEIDATDSNAILGFHHEEYSLNHCIRWGVSACDELLIKKHSNK